MEFSGTFELEDTTTDEVWQALSDPNLIWEALPGCQFLVRVEDDDPDFDALREEHADAEPELSADPDTIEERAFVEGDIYAAIVELSVGSVNPSFRTTVTIDERDKPRMSASGEGSAGNSSFEMSSWMELSETDDGVAIEWHAEADVFGRIAQMGQRMVNPVANRVVKRFFSNVQETLQDLSVEESEATEGEASTEDDGSEPAESTSTQSEESADSSGGLLARLKRLLGIGG